MSHISCPLCGKLSHVNSFHPENLPHDIEKVDMASLGRGKGFQVTGRYSALEDRELMSRIRTRLIELLEIIDGTDDGLEEEKDRVLDAVEELEDENEHLREMLAAARREHDAVNVNLQRNHDMLLGKVNDALFDVRPEGFDELEEAVENLIEEYLDTVEEAEDATSKGK